MKEHPILFSTPMVQAILEGRKTNTRRIIDPQPKPDLECFGWKTPELLQVGFGHGDKIESLHKCKYGQEGDLLWVREKWRFQEAFDFDGDNFPAKYWYYASTPEIVKCNDGEEYSRDDWKWRASIHMPKSAARIWLQVEEIRVERLQDISEEDAIAEGIMSYYDNMVSGTRFTYEKGLLSNSYTAKSEFEKLWEKINGKGSWDANPWVWAEKFKVISTTGKPQICYKTNEPCKYDCKGLCRESM